VGIELKGPVWPFENDEDGRIKHTDDIDVLAKSWMLLYLQHSRGIRVMKPNFGGGFDDFLFDQNDDVSQQLLRARCVEAERWFPVIVDRVDFVTTPGDDTKVSPIIYFRIQTEEQGTIQLNVAEAMTGGVNVQ
jgi:phage baseplate assembly protein W